MVQGACYSRGHRVAAILHETLLTHLLAVDSDGAEGCGDQRERRVKNEDKVEANPIPSGRGGVRSMRQDFDKIGVFIKCEWMLMFSGYSQRLSSL